MKISLRQLLEGTIMSRDWYAACVETLQEVIDNEARILKLQEELAEHHRQDRERFVHWLSKISASTFDPQQIEDWSDKYGKWIYENGERRRIE